MTRRELVLVAALLAMLLPHSAEADPNYELRKVQALESMAKSMKECR